MGTDFTTAQKARRARDYAEIKTVYAGHCYSEAASKWRYELETYWAKEHDDIVYAVENDAWAGKESVYAYYVDCREANQKMRLEKLSELFPEEDLLKDDNLGIGDLGIRGGTTPYIEVAKDGKTAKGIWQTIALTSYLEDEGEPKPYLSIGRDCVEFIRESEGWKIWHFRILVDMQWQIDKKYVLNKDRLFRTVGNSGTMVPATVKLRPFPVEGNYHLRRVPQISPPLPEPTQTWDPEKSYCYVVGRLDADPDCLPGGAYYVEPEEDK